MLALVFQCFNLRVTTRNFRQLMWMQYHSAMYSREFGHRVKGISMSNWALQEVKTIEKHGNEVCS